MTARVCRLRADVNDVCDFAVAREFLRIAYADTMGWQHIHAGSCEAKARAGQAPMLRRSEMVSADQLCEGAFCLRHSRMDIPNVVLKSVFR